MTPEMVIKKMLVLNKDHKPIGTKEVTVTRDFMFYRNGDYLVFVAPVKEGVNHDTRRSYDRP